MDLDRYFDSNAYGDSDSLLTTEPPDGIDSPTVGGAAMDTAGVTEAGGGMVKFDHSFQLSMFVLLLSAGLVLWIIRHIIRSRGQNSCGYKAKKLEQTILCLLTLVLIAMQFLQEPFKIFAFN